MELPRDPNQPAYKRARELRAAETPAEYKLWWALRKKKLCGLRFRRQHPLGPYFADFVCLRARFIVEVDGASHRNSVQIAHDEARTAWLERASYRVIRVWNLDIFHELHRVMEHIEAKLGERLIELGMEREPAVNAESSLMPDNDAHEVAGTGLRPVGSSPANR